MTPQAFDRAWRQKTIRRASRWPERRRLRREMRRLARSGPMLLHASAMWAKAAAAYKAASPQSNAPGVRGPLGSFLVAAASMNETMAGLNAVMEMANGMAALGRAAELDKRLYGRFAEA